MAEPEVKRITDQQLTAPSFMPVETAMLGTAMVIATILVPSGKESVDYLNEAMLLGFSGFLLFLVSKMSLIASGRMATWGPKPMRGVFRGAYIVGYLLMAVGATGMIHLSF